MAARYVLQRPNETRPSLIVDVVTTANADAIARVRKAMFLSGCANALVVDAEQVHLLRDSFSQMDETAIVEEVEPLSSEGLFGPPIGNLDERVRRWLEAMSSNWSAALPREAWVAPLFDDIVPATAGSVIEQIELAAA